MAWKSDSKDEVKSHVGKKGKQRMRVVVRVLGADLNGEKPIVHAMLRIKGVSHSFANAICTAAKIDPQKKLGSFTESEIAELEKVLKEPLEIGVPTWLLNRNRDIESGKDMHVSGPDVNVSKTFDVQRMIDKKSYKGIRHMLGLPVRGQRTRSSFRRGKAVGVIRKSIRLTAGGGVTKKEKEKEK